MNKLPKRTDFCFQSGLRQGILGLLAIGTLFSMACTSEELINRGIGAAIGAGVGLIQAESLTPEAERQLGTQIRQQILQEYPLYTASPALLAYVRNVGASLANRAERRSEYAFTFDILESKEINAFTIPGGSVFVSTELLKYLANEAELAAVLAHEIGHIDGQHPKESLRRALVAQGLVKGGLSDQQVLTAVASLTTELILRGFGREQELEADRRGLTLATHLDYDVNAMGNFFQTLLNVEGASTQGIVNLLKTHPDTEERIAVIKKFIQQNQIYVKSPIQNTQVYQSAISVLPARSALPKVAP